MAKAQSPLLGYNTNVRHKGKVFHIQTEDSGVAKPHVITHLFADGGRIIKSVKSSYADRLESPDLQTQVKKLMQDQHKAMFIALRDGVYDDQMEVTATTPALVEPPQAAAKGSPPPAAEVSPQAQAAEPVDDSIELDESSFVEDVPPPPPPPPPSATPPATPPPVAPPPLHAPSATMTSGPPRAPARQSAGWTAAPGRPAAPLGAAPLGAAPGGPPPLRPPLARATTTAPLGAPTLAATGSTPPAAAATGARSDKRTPAPSARLAPVFGERLVSERSLDEVILSYLAEELGDAPKR